MHNHICERCGTLFQEHLRIAATRGQVVLLCPTLVFFDSGNSIEEEPKPKLDGNYKGMWCVRYRADNTTWWVSRFGGDDGSGNADLDNAERFSLFSEAESRLKLWLEVRKERTSLEPPTDITICRYHEGNLIQEVAYDPKPEQWVVEFTILSHQDGSGTGRGTYYVPGWYNKPDHAHEILKFTADAAEKKAAEYRIAHPDYTNIRVIRASEMIDHSNLKF